MESHVRDLLDEELLQLHDELVIDPVSMGRLRSLIKKGTSIRDLKKMLSLNKPE